MTDIFEGLLKQFQTVLDVSTVPPIFGIRNFIWIFLILEVMTYFYLMGTSRKWQEETGKHQRRVVQIYWIKLALLFAVIRPLMLGASGGRFGSLLLNELINLTLVVIMFFRIRYTHAEQGRFEPWTDLDSYESDRTKRL